MCPFGLIRAHIHSYALRCAHVHCRCLTRSNNHTLHMAASCVLTKCGHQAFWSPIVSWKTFKKMWKHMLSYAKCMLTAKEGWIKWFTDYPSYVVGVIFYDVNLREFTWIYVILRDFTWVWEWPKNFRFLEPGGAWTVGYAAQEQKKRNPAVHGSLGHTWGSAWLSGPCTFV